jgi:hypothetical protein
VLDGYIAGLRDAGWDGDVRVVRPGYLTSVALGFGISMPGWTGHMLGEELIANTTQQFDRSADEIAYERIQTGRIDYLFAWRHGLNSAAAV